MGAFRVLSRLSPLMRRSTTRSSSDFGHGLGGEAYQKAHDAFYKNGVEVSNMWMKLVALELFQLFALLCILRMWVKWNIWHIMRGQSLSRIHTCMFEPMHFHGEMESVRYFTTHTTMH